MAAEQLKTAADALEPLVRQAREELENRNYARAVALLRRALQLAPLRYDLREHLAVALEHELTRQPALKREIELETDPPAENPFRADFQAPQREQAAHSTPRLPWWLIAATVVFCVTGVAALWTFNRRQDALFALLRRVRNLGAPEHVVQARNYYERAGEKFAEQDYENTIVFLQEAIRSNPQEAPLYQELLYRSYLNLGDEKLNEKQWPPALEYFMRAADADPGQIAPWFNIGFCNYQLARQALRKDRNAARTSEKFYRAAEAALQRALELDPRHWESLVLLAETYPKLNQLQKACDVWYQLLEIRPDSSEAKKAEINIRNYGLDPRKKQRP